MARAMAQRNGVVFVSEISITTRIDWIPGRKAGYADSTSIFDSSLPERLAPILWLSGSYRRSVENACSISRSDISFLSFTQLSGFSCTPVGRAEHDLSECFQRTSVVLEHCLR